MPDTHSIFLRGLPSGRGAATAAADQRARMLDAMARVVVRKGYARATVADVVEAASVSRRTFYEQFVDREDCFLAAYETAADIVLGDIAQAVRAVSSAGWRARLRAALEAYTDALADEPDVARLFLVDVLGAGDRALAARRDVLSRFAAQVRGLRATAAEEDPAVGQVSDQLLHALVGGINELVSDQIHREGAHTLPSLVDALEDLAHAILERSRHAVRA